MRRSLERNYRQKETLNVPFRLAEALRRDNWVHRSTLIWDKTGRSAVANSDATPECHEYVLHMVKWSSQKGRPYGNTKPLTSSVLRHHAVAHPKHGCVFPLSLVEELLSVCCCKRGHTRRGLSYQFSVGPPYVGPHGDGSP